MAGKGFVKLNLDKEDAKVLHELFKTANIKCLPESKFHVTVMYDESNPEISILPSTKNYTAKITGVERLGEKGSKWEAIALILESPEIEKRFEELKNAGFKHSYSTFKCHMSVLYGPEEIDFDLVELIFKLKVLPEVLHFGNEQILKLEK